MFKNIISGYPIQILSSFIVSIGILAFGLGHLWVAPALPKLLTNTVDNNDNTPVQISEEEGSWIASMELITLPISSISTIFLANQFGTKNVLVFGPVPVILSWILIYYAQNVWYFYIARVLVGLSEAFFYNCGPVYIGEISDPKIRGIMLFLIPVFFNIGGILSYYFGYVLSIRMFALLSIIPAALYLVLFVGMPHSPYYFIIKKQYKDAENTLRYLRGKDYVEGEVKILQEAVELEMMNKVNIKSVLSNYSYRISFGIVLMTMSFQQLCGSTAVASYLHYIINESGVSLDTEIMALIVSIITVFGSISSTFWIDRKGRRPLVLVSFSASGLLMLLLAIWFTLRENGYDLSGYDWLLGTMLCVYQFFVNFGIVNMSFVLAGELFSTNTKNYGTSVALIGYGVFGFITTKIFLFINSILGMSYNFYGFSLFSFVGVVCFYLYLPETRQKTLIEIQEMLQQKFKIEPKMNMKADKSEKC